MARIRSEASQALEEACWAVALRLKTFGYAEISAQAGVSIAFATKVVRGWADDGRCKLIQQAAGKGRNLFAIDPEKVAKPAVRGTVVQNTWNSMRGLKTFTPTDLAAHSTTPTVAVSSTAARSYCQALLRAGYLKVIRTAIPGRREAIYRLIKNTGPRPPRERRVRAVWDENLGEFTHVAGASK